MLVANFLHLEKQKYFSFGKISSCPKIPPPPKQTTLVNDRACCKPVSAERLRWRCVLCTWRSSRGCSCSTLHFGTVLSKRFLRTQEQVCVEWLNPGEIVLSSFKCSHCGKIRIKYCNTHSNLFSQLHSPLSPNIFFFKVSEPGFNVYGGGGRKQT